jgi:CTP:phosphocholine cytidylyltransferase-like protein
MTPKEKAEELVDKYDILQAIIEGFSFYDSKQCALIAVDEILSEYWSHNTKRRDWWQEVKQEIEKL